MSEKQKVEAITTQQPVEIITGEEVKLALPSDRLQQLIRNQVEGIFNAPPVYENMAPNEAREILHRYGYEISDDDSEYDYEKVREMIQETKEGQIDYKLGNTIELADAGKMIAARVNGEIVGILGYEKIGSKEGKAVYEIVRASVLPRYRGQGIYKKMAEEVIEIIVKKDPNAIIVRDTLHPAVLEVAKNQGFRLITCTEYCSLHEGWDPPSKEFEQMQDKLGRKYLKQEFGENH